ncbi:unnamed protein product [Alopecurus aequalis]
MSTPPFPSMPRSTMPSPYFCSQLLAVSVSVLLLWRPAGAAEYSVGDDGWTIGTNFVAWAQNHSFAAGDVLVFEYVKGQHNVYEVTEAAYRSCDATGPGAVLATYESGSDRVVLPDAKTYWFMCQIPGHCLGGMQLAVEVSAAAAPVASPTGAPLSASGAAAGRSSWAAWTCLVVLGLVHVLVNTVC